MAIDVQSLGPELRGSDLDGDGRVSGPEEFLDLYRRIESSAPPNLDQTLEQVIATARQAAAPDGNPEARLDVEKSLAAVPELRPVAAGLGRLRRITGPTLGTGSVQDALNFIAGRLSDHGECSINLGSGDRYRGYYGPQTVRAVRAFQGLHLLPVTGEVDQTTLQALDEALTEARSLGPIPPVRARTLRGIFFNDRFGLDVSLTFDDGPHPTITPSVLDTLEAQGVDNATFFVVGRNVARYPELVREIVARGHTLGNHTFTHPQLPNLGRAQIRDELRRTQEAVNEALQSSYPLAQMRPPYGAVNRAVRDVVREQEQAMIMWQVDSEDWRNRRTPENILTNIFEGPFPVSRAGGSILFHDVQPATESQLGTVVQRLHQQSFVITSIDQLLEQKYGTDTD